MRSISPPRLLLALALLFPFGCSSNNKGQIEGTNWTSHPADQEKAAMRLEFRADHKLVLKRGTETHQGTYALGMGPTVTLTFEDNFEGRKIHAEKIVVNGDRLTMTNSDGAQTTFQKAN